MTMAVKHLKRRSSGLYYFRRGIPKDLRKHFNGKREINLSLKTYDTQTAIKKATKLSLKTSEHFASLRAGGGERGQAVALLKEYGFEPTRLANQPDENDIELLYQLFTSDMADAHLTGHIAGDNGYEGVYRQTEPHIQRALDILHDKEPLTLDRAEGLLTKEAKDNKRITEIKRFFATVQSHLKQNDISKIRMSMAIYFDPPLANKIDPPGMV
jgi:hypothetical protein